MKLQSVKHHLAMACVNFVFSGTKCFGIKRHLLRIAGYEIGEGVKVVGPLTCTGSLKVGKNTWLGRGMKIHGNGNVVIGENCDIAPDVTFLTGGHQFGGPERRAGTGESYSIHIGDGCWIGGRSTIARNTNIGDSSVVAACACVTTDVPENTLVGGVPAKIIKKL